MDDVRIIRTANQDDDQADQIVDFVMALKKDQIAELLRSRSLRCSGTKEQFRHRIRDALDRGLLTVTDLVRHLDAVTPWGKQHVYLFEGPARDIRQWSDRAWLLAHLKRHRVGKYLNAALPIALPDKLKLSSIEHRDARIRITAVQRKVYWERRPDRDSDDESSEGDEIVLRAYQKYITRGLVAFEWDLAANVATLQITQLHREADYEETAASFAALVGAWLKLDSFRKLDVRKAITSLHEAEESGTAETRSHGIGYRTLQGRYLSGRSASSHDSLFGESAIDSALGNVRRSGVGHQGNFYWLPNVQPCSCANPLLREVHVHIIGGDKQRVRFPTPNDEGVVRYVLQRVRSRCA